MNQNEKLDRFLTSIYAEGAAARSRFSTEAAEKRAEAHAQAEHEALQVSYDYVHREVERIRTARGNRVSQTVMDCRRTLSERTEALAATLFDQVEEDILSFTETAEYPAALQKLWAEMQGALGAGAVTLYLRNEDAALGERLFSHMEWEVGDFRLGGLVAQSANRRVDGSYDTALREAGRKFVEEVDP